MIAPRAGDVTTTGADALRALGAFGAIGALMGALLLVAQPWDKSSDWIANELLGIVLVALPLARAHRGRAGTTLGVLGAVSLALFVWWSFREVAAIGAAVLLAAVFRLRTPGRGWRVEVLAALAFWTAAVAILIVPGGTFADLATRAPASGPLHPVFLPGVAVVTWVVTEALFAAHPRRGWRALDVVALALVAVCCCRADYLLDGMAVHHWSAYLGSAAVVRHGGWLLWDTPAQYGFLSTLAIAAMPGPDLWNGFFLLDVILLVVFASVLFVVFRSWPGRSALPLATAAALAFTLWVPGWGGALVTPSAGPLRFLWCQLLVFLLWLHHRTPTPRLVWMGTTVWLVGCLWSAESMFYGSLAWLPAYAFLCLRRQARWWVPPAALGATVGTIWLAYAIALGHGPDAGAFVEYVLAFRHFYASSIAPQGAVWALVLVLGLSGTTLCFAPSPLTLGATAATWAVTSYFVGNCNEVSATNLVSALGPVLAILGSVALEQPGACWSVIVRLGVGTVVIVVLTLDLMAHRWVNPAAARASSYGLTVTARRPPMRDDLVQALRDAGVSEGDPIAFFLIEDPGPGFAWTPWLPFGSLVSLMPLPEARQAEYFSRYLDRHPAPVGWLVESQAGPSSTTLRHYLLTTYHVAGMRDVGEWRITRFELGQPGIGDGR
ncbi:MAG: hypothetical protein U0807_12565 [Candidatus Binatia bacterium]